MAISFNKEVISEAIQEVLAEDQKIPVRVASKSDPSDTGSIEVMNRDKMNALKRTGKVKIDPMEEDHHENPNDDSDMAKSQLYAIAKYAIELLQMIKDGDPLDAWVQAKITKAADYVDAVQHYLEGEEYLDANQGESEEELAESDYQARTKEDLVFQYLRDAWQFGAMKGKDVNPDEELSTMADSLLANLPDYDAVELDEARDYQALVGSEVLYGGRSATVEGEEGDYIRLKFEDGKENLVSKSDFENKQPGVNEDEEIDDSKFDPEDAAKEKGFVAQDTALKARAAFKKNLDPVLATLEKKGIISRVDGKLKINDMEAYKKAIAAISEVLSESKATCCGKCGRTHVKGTECKKPFLTGKDHCRVR